MVKKPIRNLLDTYKPLGAALAVFGLLACQQPPARLQAEGAPPRPAICGLMELPEGQIADETVGGHNILFYGDIENSSRQGLATITWNEKTLAVEVDGGMVTYRIVKRSLPVGDVHGVSRVELCDGVGDNFYNDAGYTGPACTGEQEFFHPGKNGYEGEVFRGSLPLLCYALESITQSREVLELDERARRAALANKLLGMNISLEPGPSPKGHRTRRPRASGVDSYRLLTEHLENPEDPKSSGN